MKPFKVLLFPVVSLVLGWKNHDRCLGTPFFTKHGKKMTPFPVLKLRGVLCWHGSRHHGTGSSILGILDNLLTCLFCCVCDLFASVCFPRKTLLLAEEVLTKQLSFQDVYVHLVPTFFTESCKWERERPYRP